MNEKIKQLALDAGALLSPGYNVEYTVKHVDSDVLDKFAELIVRECANLCDRYQDIPATEPRHCAQDIRSLFGVKE
jgi:hypothetical protein